MPGFETENDKRQGTDAPEVADIPSDATHSPSDHTVQAGNPPAPAANFAIALLTGTTLGPYRILHKLGEGGMGAVYKAEHALLEKAVALKVLSPQITRHTESVARFRREMKAVGKLNHPNIVQAHDAGEIDGTQFLAMEFIEGIDLQNLVNNQGTLTVDKACWVIQQTAQALVSAHAAGLVHRDIKPANLLQTTSGQIKLLDMGLALLVDDSSGNTDLTLAGQTFGTPDYMAPEQWESAHKADPRTDLYALGCTLFFLLFGRAPYGTERYRTLMSKMNAHATAPVPELPDSRNDIPEGLKTIYRRLMAKSPADRIQSAHELETALLPYCAPSTLPASTGNTDITGNLIGGDNSFRTILDSAGLSSPANAANEPSSRRRRSTRSRTVLIFTTGLLLIGLASIIIRITNKDGSVTEIKVPNEAKVEIIESSPDKPKSEPDPKVKAAPAKVAESAKAIDFAVEQKAAELIHKLKGVVVVSKAGRDVFVNPTDQLPPPPYSIRAIGFTSDVLKDGDLDGLGRLPGLRSLDIAQSRLTSKGLQFLERIKNLTLLNLTKTKADDQTAKLIGRMASLEDLRLSNTSISNEGLAELVQLKNLRHLELYFTSVGNEGMRHVSQLTSLTDLRLGESRVGNEGLAILAPLKDLEFIALGGQVTADGLEHLVAFPKLTIVANLKPRILTSEGIDHLRSVRNLKILNVVDATDETLEVLRTFENIKNCSFNSNRFSIAGLQHLREFKSLEHLDLSENASLDDTCIDHISNCASLKEVSLLRLGITKAGIAKLRAARPDLKIETDTHPKFEHGTLE